MEQQRESMGQVGLGERVRCGRRPAAVRCRDPYGRGEQRAAWRCAVVCRHDHAVHRKSFGLCCECNVQLEHGGMENVLSCVFLVERCVNVDKLVNEMIPSNVQALMVVESDHEVKVYQETSSTDVKFTRQGKSCGELFNVGGSSNVSKESPMSASAANALIEKSVREMQSTSSMVFGTMSELGCATSTWTVEIVRHVVGRSQSSVADVRTACERRKRKSCRKALVKFDELVMLMTIEKPKHKGNAKVKGKVDANTIMLGLVDRPDEVVVGMADRVVKARVVYRVPKEQRRGVPWHQTSAEMEVS